MIKVSYYLTALKKQYWSSELIKRPIRRWMVPWLHVIELNPLCNIAVVMNHYLLDNILRCDMETQ